MKEAVATLPPSLSAGPKPEARPKNIARLRSRVARKRKDIPKAAKTTLDPGYDLRHTKIDFSQFRNSQAITTCKQEQSKRINALPPSNAH
jgi:alpha-D-ribose 1-methylphosphonate 5-triphosphate synthase subunit PhnI